MALDGTVGTTDWTLDPSNGDLVYSGPAVPEPPTLCFLLPGLAMLARAGRRRAARLIQQNGN